MSRTGDVSGPFADLGSLKRAAAACVLGVTAVLGGCEHPNLAGSQGVRLDELLGFANPQLCKPTQSHARFLDAMVEGDAEKGFHAGRLNAPAPFRRAFGHIDAGKHEHWWTIEVPVSGTLFGLPLRRIGHALPTGGDPGGVTYTFHAPLPEVELALRAAGFPVRANEDVLLGPPEGYEHVMSLNADPDNPERTFFGCSYQ